MYKYVSTPVLLKRDKKVEITFHSGSGGKMMFFCILPCSIALQHSLLPLKIGNCCNELRFILLLILGLLLATYSCNMTCWGDNEVIIGGDICSG